MNKLLRLPNYLGRLFLPTRPGTTILPWRVQAALDRAATAANDDAGKLPANTELTSHREPPETVRRHSYSHWFARLLALGLVFCLLVRANRWLGLETMLHSDWPSLHAFWLPLVFTLLYFVAWLGRLIWEAASPEKLTRAFPDIDLAWIAGLRRVAESGINVREAPLFLVLGRPSAAGDETLTATPLDCKAKVPPGQEAPLHFSATQDGIFVSCADTSVLGRHLSPLIEKTFLKNKAQFQEVLARLRHLCQLIVRERRSCCPINGIVVLFPLTAIDHEEDTNRAGTACELDLTVVRETVHVQCPIFAVFGGAEKSPGFAELLSRMPVGQPDCCVGQRFPLVADVEASAVPEMIRDGVNWFTDTFLPTLVYNLFRVETLRTSAPLGSSSADTVNGNLGLYQFLNDMRSRRRRLTQLLTRGLLLDTPNTFFFGGFYLTGAGPDPGSDPGLLGGVFQKLLENQNQFAWSPDALAEETDFRRWIWCGRALLLFLVAGLGLLVYRLW